MKTRAEPAIAPAPAQSYAYDYDLGGNVSEILVSSTAGGAANRYFTFDSSNNLTCQGTGPGLCNKMTVLYDAAGIRIGQTEPGNGNRTKVHFGTEFQWTQATNLQEARIEVRGLGGDIGYKYMGVATLRTEAGDALGIEPRVIGHWVVVFVLSGVVANGVLLGVGARQRKRRLAYPALATMGVVICLPGMAGACSAPQPPCASELHRIPRRLSNG